MHSTRSAHRADDTAPVTVQSLAPVLTPHGRLALVPAEDGAGFAPAGGHRLIVAFNRGSGHGILQLGAGEVGTSLPAVLGYWREFGARFVTAVCSLPDVEEVREKARVPPLSPAELDEFALAAPPMKGAEYLTPSVLQTLWGETANAFVIELAEFKGPVQEFLKGRHPAWNLIGRVHFSLAENRNDARAPFAFLATYTTRLSSGARAQHLPLGEALRQYAGAASKDRLLSLLLPVQRAAEKCPWLEAMVREGEIFHPLRWTPGEAYRLLNDIPALEAAGVVARVPAGWRANRPPRPQVTATVGGAPPAGLGTDALLDFKVAVTLEGEPLSPEEVRRLLAGTDGLVMIRGRWVELDRDGLERMLEQFRSVERVAAERGLGFAEAMRMLASADVDGKRESSLVGPAWSRVVAGPWLAEMLAGLRTPEALARVDPGSALRTELRPYQQVGLRWLALLSQLGLGACLADDMGLGKTIQVLALLLTLKARKDSEHAPSLLVAPASLLANWMSEIERFAPSLRPLVAHPSAMTAAQLVRAADQLEGTDLVITSYGSLLRIPWLATVKWRLAILDEAQAIKNPAARQTRAVKALDARARIVLTGTPVENRLSDLWSIFDFISPGLLGTGAEFTAFAKRLATRTHNPYAPLRDLVRPYILRRLKTDKSVIADLPDKVEVKAFCRLSRKQAALYQRSVEELSERLLAVEGIRRKGVVLSFLTRFKQICNHPSHWLGDGIWAEPDSGKLGRLREIVEAVADRQEKMLVFTQFREMVDPLSRFLGSVFDRPGLVLHGGTAVGKRKDVVRRFQEDETVPFFVLSLKAGGTGLNLTAASHVIHYDRWWNPAVEDQATDRAFRIGQTRNVLVHKFVCRGTLEEKIDQMMDSKRRLSQELLEGGAELLLTEMKDDELLNLVALDLKAASLET